MVKIIASPKGFGKTKTLIEYANQTKEKNSGIFIAASSDLNLEISSKIRLVDACEFEILDYNTLYGVIVGIFLSNYEIETIIIDNLLKIVKNNNYTLLYDFVEKLEALSQKRESKIYLSISESHENIPTVLEKYLI